MTHLGHGCENSIDIAVLALHLMDGHDSLVITVSRPGTVGIGFVGLHPVILAQTFIIDAVVRKSVSVGQLLNDGNGGLAVHGEEIVELFLTGYPERRDASVRIGQRDLSHARNTLCGGDGGKAVGTLKAQGPGLHAANGVTGGVDPAGVHRPLVDHKIHQFQDFVSIHKIVGIDRHYNKVFLVRHDGPVGQLDISLRMLVAAVGDQHQGVFLCLAVHIHSLGHVLVVFHGVALGGGKGLNALPDAIVGVNIVLVQIGHSVAHADAVDPAHVMPGAQVVCPLERIGVMIGGAEAVYHIVPLLNQIGGIGSIQIRFDKLLGAALGEGVGAEASGVHDAVLGDACVIGPRLLQGVGVVVGDVGGQSLHDGVVLLCPGGAVGGADKDDVSALLLGHLVKAAPGQGVRRGLRGPGPVPQDKDHRGAVAPEFEVLRRVTEIGSLLIRRRLRTLYHRMAIWASATVPDEGSSARAAALSEAARTKLSRMESIRFMLLPPRFLLYDSAERGPQKHPVSVSFPSGGECLIYIESGSSRNFSIRCSCSSEIQIFPLAMDSIPASRRRYRQRSSVLGLKNASLEISERVFCTTYREPGSWGAVSQYCRR